MWDEKHLEGKRKLRYYKEVINCNLEDQKYLSVVTSSRKKINIAKIRTNSHELHSETRSWSIPKISWVERVSHLRQSMNVEDENYFHSICNNTNICNLLTCQNYNELGKLLGKFF